MINYHTTPTLMYSDIIFIYALYPIMEYSGMTSESESYYQDYSNIQANHKINLINLAAYYIFPKNNNSNKISKNNNKNKNKNKNNNNNKTREKYYLIMEYQSL